MRRRSRFCRTRLSAADRSSPRPLHHRLPTRNRGRTTERGLHDARIGSHPVGTVPGEDAHPVVLELADHQAVAVVFDFMRPTTPPTGGALARRSRAAWPRTLLSRRGASQIPSIRHNGAAFDGIDWPSHDSMIDA